MFISDNIRLMPTVWTLEEA